MEDSKIEWTVNTFNPWTGCTKVSPGCLHCYAEAWSKRSGIVEWGKGKARRRTSAAMWRKPLKWQKMAQSTRIRIKVFCASLADWLDDEVPVEWLADLLFLIFRTPDLDWQLLSKRPQNYFRRMAAVWAWLAEHPEWVAQRVDEGSELCVSWLSAWILSGRQRQNVWIGTTVEDQERANERIPALLKIPARVRFLSCEPLLEKVHLGPMRLKHTHHVIKPLEQIHWVICGGESGPGARPMHPDWARSLRDQCQAAGVPFLFKQWGEWAPQLDQDAQPIEYLVRGKLETFPDTGADGDYLSAVLKIGKKAAGRLLDGREHNEFPEVARA